MRIRVHSLAKTLLNRAGITFFAGGVLSLTACESLDLFGARHQKFDENLPELDLSRIKDPSLEGMIDRKAELKMLKVKSRMAVIDEADGGGEIRGKGARALVVAHWEKDKSLARVQLVHGTDKLNYTDTAYFDGGELFRYVSKFSHTVEQEGYFKITVISDEYQIMNGAITQALSVTKNKIRDQGNLVKNDTKTSPLGGARLSVEEMNAAVERRLAFVTKKMRPEEFLIGEAH